MPLSAGNTVGIQPVTDEWRAGPSDGREAFPEIKPVIVVALAFIVLCDQLKLPGFIDVQRTSSHDVQPIGVLQAGLGVIKQGGIAVTVKPAAKFLICHGKTSGDMLISAGDSSGNAFIVIFTAAKATFGASLKLHHGFRLAFFGHDVDQATGTAAAVQGRRTGDHFNMVDIKRIYRVQLSAVGT
ncbi:hypothetical protein BvCmsKSNP115_00678 [Escherichia coli]|nr:hypothetical protein BvCmsKSNP115_00678 [Escherichia coli]SQS72575.1 Uncharacterised protein [Escherichia coli]